MGAMHRYYNNPSRHALRKTVFSTAAQIGIGLFLITAPVTLLAQEAEPGVGPGVGAVPKTNTDQAKTEPSTQPGAWLDTITLSTRGGHIIGNPQAQKQIVEYASYTCGHCGTFDTEEVPKLKQEFVQNGSASFEVRNLVRDEVDLTVSILARCGKSETFFARHTLWMASQGEWTLAAKQITPATNKLLKQDNISGFLTGIYTDMQLSKYAAQTGVSDTQAKQCLADPSILQSLINMTDEATATYKVTSTPSFLINDILVDVHGYDGLKPLISK